MRKVRRGSAERKHTVKFMQPRLSLGNTDMTFEVYDGERKAGTLLISRGAVVWKSRNSELEYRYGWRRFDAVMRASVTPVNPTLK